MTDLPRSSPPPPLDPAPIAGRTLGSPDRAGGRTHPASTTPTGFDDLYRREWSPLVALGWSLTGNWQVAEELAQDAFADAFRRWDHVEGLDHPGAWVRRAVINRSASHHRSRGSERRGLALVGSRARADRAGQADSTGDQVAAQVGDPAFWATVRSLPERQLACVALHYLEDRSVADIAQVLELRPATVKVHLHRGRISLARRLAAMTEGSVEPSAGKHTAGRGTATEPTTDELREGQP